MHIIKRCHSRCHYHHDTLSYSSPLSSRQVTFVPTVTVTTTHCRIRPHCHQGKSHSSPLLLSSRHTVSFVPAITTTPCRIRPHCYCHHDTLPHSPPLSLSVTTTHCHIRPHRVSSQHTVTVELQRYRRLLGCVAASPTHGQRQSESMTEKHGLMAILVRHGVTARLP